MNRWLRQLHRYLGVFFAPLLLLYVATGWWQTVTVNRNKGLGFGKSWIERLSTDPHRPILPMGHEGLLDLPFQGPCRYHECRIDIYHFARAVDGFSVCEEQDRDGRNSARRNRNPHTAPLPRRRREEAVKIASCASGYPAALATSYDEGKLLRSPHWRLQEGPAVHRLDPPQDEMNSMVDLRATIYEGAVQQLHPKVMTACAILFGLLPIMWSPATQTGADVMKRIATPMIDGVITSTFLELLIYP